MKAIGQTSAYSELSILAENKKHSILIEGAEGTGKTYLAREYARMLSVADFQIVDPKVQDIRDAVTSCSMLSSPVVLCIENLDTGMLSASYALLKFLEEPPMQVYIVVTCRNIQNIPDTIISRSECVTVGLPTTGDLDNFAKYTDEFRYSTFKLRDLWKTVVTYNDVHTILQMDASQVEYFDSLVDVVMSKDTISNKSWKLQKYPSGKDTPTRLVIRHIMNSANSKSVWDAGYRCLKDIDIGRLSANAVLSKFLMDCKYIQ